MPFDPATLKYDAAGLVPCVAQDAASGEVLMVAWMNAASVSRTLETGKVTYWSRSRGEFWVKGETSGHHQRLVELRVDCDRDCLLALDKKKEALETFQKALKMEDVTKKDAERRKKVTEKMNKLKAELK